MVVLSFVAGVAIGLAIAAVYWATQYWEVRRHCDMLGQELAAARQDYADQQAECRAWEERLLVANARRSVMQYEPFSNN